MVKIYELVDILDNCVTLLVWCSERLRVRLRSTDGLGLQCTNEMTSLSLSMVPAWPERVELGGSVALGVWGDWESGVRGGHTWWPSALELPSPAKDARLTKANTEDDQSIFV